MPIWGFTSPKAQIEFEYPNLNAYVNYPASPHPQGNLSCCGSFLLIFKLRLYFMETLHPCPDVPRERPFWFWNAAFVSVALAWILQELEINCSPCQENCNTTWSLDARDPYHRSCRVTRGGWGWCTPDWKTGFPAEMLLEPQNTTAISDPALSSPLGGWGWEVWA